MTTYLHIYGPPDIWTGVINALREWSTSDADGLARLADHIAHDTARGVRFAEIHGLGAPAVRELAVALTDRVRQCWVRQSEHALAPEFETVGLYHAGQRLAQRSVAWPTRAGDPPRIINTQTEFGLRVRIVTDLPERLDTILNELTIHQANPAKEGPRTPCALALPNAEGSWGQLPGFRPIFTMMIGPSDQPGKWGDFTSCVRLPEPQALVYLDTVERPAATVFDLHLRLYGLPAHVVLHELQRRFGSWGMVHPITADDQARSRGHVLATLGMTLPPSMDRHDGWNTLYVLAGQTDAILHWPADSDDPHAWADLGECHFSDRPAGLATGQDWLAISRRVPLLLMDPDESLIDRLAPGVDRLPPTVQLEIACPGPTPWFRSWTGRLGQGTEPEAR